MKKFAICLVLVLLLVGLSNAQTKTMIGTVVRFESGNRWAGVVVKVGKKEYFILTDSAAAPADPNQEVAPTAEVIGNVEVGRTVKIYYTRISNDGEVRATKIVEVKKAKSPMQAVIKPRGGTQSQDWGSFWNAFSTAARSRNRKRLETLMSDSFVDGGGMARTSSERMSFLNGLSKRDWRRMDVAIRQGTVFDRGCNCRTTKSLRLEFRIENGKWRWEEAWFSGD